MANADYIVIPNLLNRIFATTSLTTSGDIIKKINGINCDCDSK